MDLPFSAYASDAARAHLTARLEEPPHGADILELRTHYTRFNDAIAEEAAAKYDVEITEEIWGGVRVHRVTPRATPDKRKPGMLVNLHGGAFMWGAGSGALVEAIPVAAIANTTVVTVDYRMAPEHQFPAATEDVCAVYRRAIETCDPREIGLYGCSAGAILTAQTIAALRAEGTPLPGAIAMLCGASCEFAGDSGHLAAPLTGAPVEGPLSLFNHPYMREARRDDPLAMPECDDDLLAAFPPTLLITASRDFAASSVTRFHRLLSSQGVDARLFMFDGLWHAFQIFPGLPEAEEAHRILADFFDRTLRSTR